MIAINGTLRELFEEGTIVPVSNVIRLYEGGTLVKTIDEGIESIREKSSIETEPFGVVPVSNVTLSFSGLNGLSTEKEYDLEFDSIFRLNDELQPTYTSRRYTSLVPKYDKRSNKVTITALDQFGKLSSQYQPLDIAYPCTYYDWVSLFFYTVTGLAMEQSSIYNGDYVLTQEPNLDSTYSNATVASRIAMFSLSLVYVSPDNKVRFVPLSKFKSSATDYTITDKAKDFTDDTDRFKTLGINTLVLGLQSDIDGENVSREDSSMVSVDGTVELRLDDIPFIPTQSEKESIIDAMFTEIKGFKYKAYNLTFGVGAYFFLEIGDNVAQEILNYGTDESPVYSNIPIFSVENIFAGSIQTVFSATSGSVSQTESKWEQLSPSKRTEIRVNKVDQEILKYVENIGDFGDTLVEQRLNLEGVTTTVENVNNINIIANNVGTDGIKNWSFVSQAIEFTTPSAEFNSQWEFVSPTGAIARTVTTTTIAETGFEIWGRGSMISDKARIIHPADRYCLRVFTKGAGKLVFKVHELDASDNLLKTTTLSTISSSIGWTQYDSEFVPLSNTENVQLEIVSTVNPYSANPEMSQFSDLMLVRNIYKNYEVNAQDVMDYVRAEIAVMSNEISLKVSTNEVISAINVSTESVKIQGPKIELEGVVTANSYFKILADGSMEAVNGTFTGNLSAGTIAGLIFNASKITFPDGKLALNSATNSIEFGTTRMRWSTFPDWNNPSVLRDGMILETTAGSSGGQMKFEVFSNSQNYSGISGISAIAPYNGVLLIKTNLGGSTPGDILAGGISALNSFSFQGYTVSRRSDGVLVAS